MGVAWISHRGYCKNATENTLDAFAAAKAIGYKIFECDIRISKDGQLFLSHDVSLKRMINSDTKVESLTCIELEKIDLPFGGRIAFFADFYATYSEYELVLDIKPEQADRSIPALVDFFARQKRDALERIIFLLWTKNHEAMLKKAFPQARFFTQEPKCRQAAWTLWMGMPWLSGVKKNQAYALPPSFGPFNLYQKHLIDRYHALDAKVIGFLPETKEEAIAAIACGVDYIISNHEIFST